MATYTVTDGNGRESGLSWYDACESIEGWYADVACWATGEASDDEMDAVASAIDSVPQPEEDTGLAGLEQYVSAICDAVAAALGYGAVAGHGNYYVSASDRAGLDLRVEVEETRRYRVYAATTEHGGVHGIGQGDEYYEAETAAEAAQMAADDWDWDSDDWDGGDVIVATDDNGDSYHLHRTSDAAKKIGNVWYTDDAEYAVRHTASGAAVVRGDGSYAEFLSIDDAEEAAEALANGESDDSEYEWVDC